MSLHPRSPHPFIDSKIHRALPLLYRWFSHHQRPLPWRLHPSPYRIAVSEFMCQQTRITTVIPYYHRWLRRFPSWSALARAPQAAVLRHWEGLGYYRRARFLHALAKAVQRLPQRQLPSDPRKLRLLPGIGHYTAGAISSIAFAIPSPAFDGNVARVLGRLLARRRRSPNLKKLQEFAAAIVPKRNPGIHNQALMELGALVCLPKIPLCSNCPLRSICPSRNKLPRSTTSRPKPTTLREILLIVQHGKSVWLTRQHPANRWRSLSLLPTLSAKPKKALPIGKILYPYTRYHISADVFLSPYPPKDIIGRWFNPAALRLATLPAPHRRALLLLPQNRNL